MGQTSLPYGSPQAIQIQSAGLFAANMQRPTLMNKMTGKLPQQADAEKTLRFQSSNDYPVVRCMDLTKSAGDEITFDLINPVGGKPIMGEKMAEGRGDAMSFSQDDLRINQSRKPISAGGKMTQQRTRHELRRLARSLAYNYMTRLEDQECLVHLAGARGSLNDIEWAIPLSSDPDFSEIVINTVKAPTKNRHFISNSTGIDPVTETGNVIDLATTDIMNTDVIDAIRTKLDGMPLPPPPIRIDGDMAATDDPIRLLLVSPEQYRDIVQSTNFRTFQANAMARAAQAKNHPLFMGEVGLWNGILIRKMPKAIRFFAGEVIPYCASTTSETETTTDTVASGFSTTHAVDRALLIGAQALCEAYGKASKTGNPFFWSEKELDHDDKLEVLIGKVGGKSKTRFLIDHGTEEQYTDFGVIAIDTAVAIA